MTIGFVIEQKNYTKNNAEFVDWCVTMKLILLLKIDCSIIFDTQLVMFAQTFGKFIFTTIYADLFPY